jgi:hypothetical protein
MYTTNIDKCLLERVHHLSVEAKIRPNHLLEQAIKEYLEKHEPLMKSGFMKNPKGH